MAYTTLVAGTTITAAWANASVRDQSVAPFASAAARSSAITAPVEGMVTHLNDTNMLGVYSGSAWCSTGPMSAGLPTWSAVVQQGVGVGATVTYATYSRVGRKFDCQFSLSCTGAGTATSAIQIGGLPATPAQASYNVVGAGHFVDVSISNRVYPCLLVIPSSTSVLQLWGTETNTANTQALGTTGSPTAAALASGDVLTGTFWFEANADS